MEKKIYYHDTDSGGVVYYANYLKYMEEARTDYLHEKCAGISSLLDRGMFYAVRSCQIHYKAPARYADVLVVDAKIKRMSGAQIVFMQTVMNKITGQVCVEGEIALVCLNADFKPCAIPVDIKEKLKFTLL